MGLTVLKLLIKQYKLHVLINSVRTAGPTRIWVLHMSFSDNMLQDNHIGQKFAMIILREHTKHAECPLKD